MGFYVLGAKRIAVLQSEVSFLFKVVKAFLAASKINKLYSLEESLFVYKMYFCQLEFTIIKKFKSLWISSNI